MGYYTQHSLELRRKSNEQPVYGSKHYKVLIGKHEKEIEETTEGGFDDEYKWYDREEDMKAHSIKYPHILFIIDGYGEEQDDTWKEYYLNGKVQHEDGEIKYGEFNKDLLT